MTTAGGRGERVRARQSSMPLPPSRSPIQVDHGHVGSGAGHEPLPLLGGRRRAEELQVRFPPSQGPQSVVDDLVVVDHAETNHGTVAPRRGHGAITARTCVPLGVAGSTLSDPPT